MEKVLSRQSVSRQSVKSTLKVLELGNSERFYTNFKGLERETPQKPK